MKKYNDLITYYTYDTYDTTKRAKSFGTSPILFAYRERSVQMDKLLVTILTCAVIIAKEVLNDD